MMYSQLNQSRAITQAYNPTTLEMGKDNKTTSTIMFKSTLLRQAPGQKVQNLPID